MHLRKVPQAGVVGNAREDGKGRGKQLDETSVFLLNLVEAGPLSKYMSGPGAKRVARAPNERKRKNKNPGP